MITTIYNHVSASLNVDLHPRPIPVYAPCIFDDNRIRPLRRLALLPVVCAITLISAISAVYAAEEAIVDDGRCWVVNDTSPGGFGEIDISSSKVTKTVFSYVNVPLSVSYLDDEKYRQIQEDKHTDDLWDFADEDSLPGQIEVELYAEWPSDSGKHRLELAFRGSGLDDYAHFLHGRMRMRTQQWRVRVKIGEDVYLYKVPSGDHAEWIGLERSAPTGFPYRGGETLEISINDPDGPALIYLKGKIPTDLAEGIDYGAKNQHRVEQVCKASHEYVRAKGVIDSNPKKDDPRYPQVQQFLRDMASVGGLISHWKKSRDDIKPDTSVKESFKMHGISLLQSLDAFLKKNPNFTYFLNDGTMVEFAKERDILLRELKIVINDDQEPIKQNLSLQLMEVPSSKEMPKLVELMVGGDIDEIRAELRRTGQPNAHKDGFTALAEAAKRGKTDLIRLLVDSGASINWRSWGSSPIREAAISGQPDTVKLLLELGADVDMRSGDKLFTPLIEAAIRGHADVISVLLDADAFPNAVGIDGLRALDHARKRGHDSAARLLEPVSWK